MRIDGNNFNFFNVGNSSAVDQLLSTILPALERTGTSASASELLPGQEHTIPNDDSMPDYYQGQTNGCGTTSLAMIMSYLGIPETQADIDGAIRRMDVFTNPTDILD